MFTLFWTGENRILRLQVFAESSLLPAPERIKQADAAEKTSPEWWTLAPWIRGGLRRTA